MQKAMEGYKASEECYQEKLLFAQPTFVEGMEDTQRRILGRYSNLNLNFMYEDEWDNEGPIEGAPTLGAEVAGTKGGVGPST